MDKSKKTKKLLLISLEVLALVILGVFLVVALKYRNAKDDDLIEPSNMEIILPDNTTPTPNVWYTLTPLSGDYYCPITSISISRTRHEETDSGILSSRAGSGTVSVSGYCTGDFTSKQKQGEINISGTIGSYNFTIWCSQWRSVSGQSYGPGGISGCWWKQDCRDNGICYSLQSRCCNTSPPPTPSGYTVTTHHYVSGTTTQVHADDTQSVSAGGSYSTSYYGTGSLISPYTNAYQWDGVTPSNASGNASANIEVTYYYSQIPPSTAKVTVHHYEVGSTTKVADDDVLTYNAATTYDVSSYHKATSSLYSTHNGQPYSGGAFEWNNVAPSNQTGTVTLGQNIEVSFYYRETRLLVHYVLEDGVTVVHADDSAYLTYGHEYGSVPRPTNELNAPYTNLYEWNNVVPPHRSGIAGDDVITGGAGTAHQTIDTTYVYRKRQATITIHHYVVGTTTQVHADDTFTVNYEGSYDKSTAYYGTASLISPYTNNYQWNGSTPSNASGNNVSGNITITFYYTKRSATLTIHHYVVGTTTKVHADDTFTVYYTDQYDKRTAYYGTGSLISPYTNVYEWNKSTPSNAYGTVSDNITINFYYRTTTVITRHYLVGTTTRVHADDSVTKFYGNNYSTTYYATGNLNDTYKNKYEWNKVTPSNASGTVADGVITSGAGTSSQVIEKIYYYRTTSLIVHHYLENSATQVHNDDVSTVFYGATYNTTNYATGALKSPYTNIYEWNKVNPSNKTATVADAAITGGAGTNSQQIVVSYYYRLRPAKLTVRHYVVGTTTSVCPTDVNESLMTYSYEAKTCTNTGYYVYNGTYNIDRGTGTYNSSNYKITGTHTVPTDDGGTIITYYYNLPKYSITVHHYLVGTTTKVYPDEVENNVNRGTHYERTAKTPAQLNSPYTNRYSNVASATTGQTSGNITANTTINFYYTAMPSKLIVKHIIKGTNNYVDYVNTDYEYSTNVYFDDSFSVTPTSHTVRGNTSTPGVNISNLYKLDRITVTGANNPATNISNQTATGTIKDNPATVTFEYVGKTATVKVNHYIMQANGTKTTTQAPGTSNTTETVFIGNNKSILPSSTVDTTYQFKQLDVYKGSTLVTSQSLVPYVVSGMAEGDVYTVNLYYQELQSKVVSRYINCDTGVEVANSRESFYRFNTNYTGTQITVNGYNFKGDRYTLYPNDPDRGDPKEGTATKQEYRVDYCYKKQYQVDVKYIDVDTNTELDHETIATEDGARYTTVEKTFTDYRLVSVDGSREGYANSTTVDANGVIHVTYKYRKNFTLTIKHLKASDSTPFQPDIVRTMARNESYTANEISINNYHLLRVEGNTSGTITANTTVIFYYTENVYNVTEKYEDCDTHSEISSSRRTQHNYLTEPTFEKINIENYNYVEVTSDATTSTQLGNGKIKVKVEKPETSVTFCYRKKTSTLVVHYKDCVANTEVSSDDVTNGLSWGERYNTSPKVIPNYTNTSSIGQTSGVVGSTTVDNNNQIVVTYCYQRNTGSLTVRYLEDVSEQVLATPHEYTMNYGDSYNTNTTRDKLNITNYQLIRVSGNESGTISGNVIITYYYRRLSGHITIKYNDCANNTTIASNTELDWNLGDNYSTIPYIKTIDNYVFANEHVGPETGTMGNPTSNVTVTYCYNKKTVELVVKYVDNKTGNEFPNSRVTQTKNHGDHYTTEQKEFTNYQFTSVDRPTSGYIYNQLVITYYYDRLEGVVRAYYLDIDNHEQIATNTEETIPYGTSYSTTQKTIPKYDFVRYDGTPSGTLSTDTVDVTYYYQKQKGKVITRHFKRGSGEQIGNDIVNEYKLDERYTTSSITVENYELVATPDNYIGVITSTTPIIVNYYYDQLSGVVITKYIDVDTGEEILPTVREGKNYGDSYTTTRREIDNYEWKRTDGVPSGIFNNEEVVVTYFYEKKKATVTVEYLDAVTGRNLRIPLANTYPFGQRYTTQKEIFENYEYESVSGSETGTVSGDVIVKYYYRTKEATITVNFLEDQKNTVIKDREMYNVNYGEDYQFRPVNINDFDYVRTDGDDESGTVDENKVINYYYRRKSANLTVHHLESGTDRILANEDRETVYYGMPYSTTSKDIEGYLPDAARYPDNDHGTVTDNIEVTYYYDRKEASVVTSYVDTKTNTPLKDPKVDGYNIGDTYTTKRIEFENYELVDHDGAETGKVTKDRIDVVYYYAKKTGVITIKYLDETTLEELSPSITNTVDYGDPYTSTGIDRENYELDRIEGDPSGTVDGDIVVIYYYKLKDATLKVQYLELDTNQELHSETIINYKYGDHYETEKQNIKDFEFVMVEGNPTGTMNQREVIVIYYYQRKQAQITSKYIEEGTNREIASPQSQTVGLGKYYTTSPSGEVTANYELVRKTDNYEGIARQEQIYVYYYYKKLDSSLVTKLTKVGSDEITSKDENVDYEINYEAKIVDYLGDVKVTLTDKLPYKIDTGSSNLDGGVYNEYKKTIEWVEDISDLDTINGTDTIVITKYISLKYVGIEPTERTMANTITGTIKLSNNSQEKEDSLVTKISIPGSIVVHHYIQGTDEELVPSEYSEGLVGDTYICHPHDIEGYNIVTRPSQETITYNEGEQEIIYEYERIKFHIDVEVIGGIGEATGNEEVYYGDDSTPNNIVITPGNGYEISRIIINGTDYEFDNSDSIILDNFINVQEDINIKIEFTEKPLDVPITGSTSKYIIIASILVFITAIFIAGKVGLFTKILKR